MTRLKFSLAPIGPARLYYETAGEGWPLVMIHTGGGDAQAALALLRRGMGAKCVFPHPPPQPPSAPYANGR